MARYGIDVLIRSLLLLFVIALCTFLFIESAWVQTVTYAILVALALLILNFFRDPERAVPDAQNLVLSPADGRIVVISRVREEEFLGGEAVLVSIFMSPLDVHVNRIPVTGKVRLLRHISGKFTVAFSDKASEVNERMIIGLERQGGGRVLMKQIAGTVARRIVADLREDQNVAMGERFGMIKFGSRVDLFVPASCAVNVELHQRVTAGETIVATYPPNA